MPKPLRSRATYCSHLNRLALRASFASWFRMLHTSSPEPCFISVCEAPVLMPYVGRMGGTQDASANQQHTIPSNTVIGAWVA